MWNFPSISLLDWKSTNFHKLFPEQQLRLRPKKAALSIASLWLFRLWYKIITFTSHDFWVLNTSQTWIINCMRWFKQNTFKISPEQSNNTPQTPVLKRHRHKLITYSHHCSDSWCNTSTAWLIIVRFVSRQRATSLRLLVDWRRKAQSGALCGPAAPEVSGLAGFPCLEHTYRHLMR